MSGRSARTETLGRGCDDAGIPRNLDRALVPFSEDRFVRPAKLANGKMTWFARVRHQIEQLTDERLEAAPRRLSTITGAESSSTTNASQSPTIGVGNRQNGQLEPLLLRESPANRAPTVVPGIERRAGRRSCASQVQASGTAGWGSWRKTNKGLTRSMPANTQSSPLYF